MNSIDQIRYGEEINFKELFLFIWAYKFLIVFICGMCLVIGGYLAITSEKKFISKAVFKLSQNAKSNTGSLGSLDALASLSGINMETSSDDVSEEKIKGRVFIEKINNELNLVGDDYFNKKKSVRVEEPIWKSTIKKLINYESNLPDLNELMWQSIQTSFSENIFFDMSKSKIITLKVIHNDADRASIIANTIMTTILNDAQDEKNDMLNDQLEYLTSSMANSLNELELVQAKLKTFAMENSALPLESFAIGSLQLDTLREKLGSTVLLYNAASELKLILQKESISQKDYIELSKNFPIVDEIEFRRVLGQSEVRNSWTWPEESSVDAILDTLSERIKRLQTQIETSQKNAETSGKALEVYAKLKREEKVAEATYAVLIERVKAQSMNAGYTPDNSVIFEYAAPAVYAAKPNKILYLMWSLVIGLVLGSFFSWVLSRKKNVYYSTEALITNTDSKFNLNIKSLLALRKLNLSTMKNTIIKKSHPSIRDIVVEINKGSSKFIIISSLNAKIKSNEFARIVSSYLQRDNIKIAIINFSSKEGIQMSADDKDLIGPFQVIKKDGPINILQPKDSKVPMDYLSHQMFQENLVSLGNSFDLIFVCADNNDSISLVRALHLPDYFHITLTRLRHTNRGMLAQLSLAKPIQGLLYV